ncbi:hypothetical protein GLOIN_2v1764552 [Rhizophagus clarus]|uniref:NYN domain-containing protein n=2 Tax=Rhizophagus clarus TaxID=94130 RepID=A0A8H3LMY2_9GLOM|nr:hypothetical protein GLOIN_2v1764552 [Rhizophagus clarus]
MVILIARDGDYGLTIRKALDKHSVKIWFWKVEFCANLPLGFNDSLIKNIILNMKQPLNLDDYHKKFMFADRYNNNLRANYLEIFTDKVRDNDVMECYIVLDLFSWWLRPGHFEITYSQWEELKNLMINKYPNAKQINREAIR